jgi:hypothetical protein
MKALYVAQVGVLIVAVYIGEHGHRGLAQWMAIGVLVVSLAIRSWTRKHG